MTDANVSRRPFAITGAAVGIAIGAVVSWIILATAIVFPAAFR